MLDNVFAERSRYGCFVALVVEQGLDPACREAAETPEAGQSEDLPGEQADRIESVHDEMRVFKQALQGSARGQSGDSHDAAWVAAILPDGHTRYADWEPRLPGCARPVPAPQAFGARIRTGANAVGHCCCPRLRDPG